MAVAACGDPAAPTPAVLTVTPEASALMIGNTVQLQVAATRDDAPVTDETYTYATENALIATVSPGGVVTAVALGTTKIAVTATSGGSVDVPISVVTGPPAQITKATGDGQTANVGSAVPIPPSVVVKDEVGTPIPNVSVIFAPANGGGSITGAFATTNAAGVAVVGAWTLGTAGENTMTATVDGVTETFTATATQPVISLDVTTLAFTGTANGAAPASKNIAVTNSGEGTLSGLAIGIINYGTGATGWLSAALIGTSAPATVSVTASQFGLAAGTYTATIPITAPGAAPRIVSVTMSVTAQVAASVAFPQSEVTLQQAATSLVPATLKDVSGNAMSGAITYASRNSAVATVNSSGAITGVAAGQAVIVGTFSSTIADSVLAIVTGSDAAVVVSSLSSFTLTKGATHTVSIYVDMTGATKKLASGQLDITWTVPQMVYDSHAAGAGVAATVNTTNAAAGLLRISFADPAGLTGRVEVLKITFKNTATAGLTGELKLTANELTATDFSDLNALAIEVTRSLIVK